MTDPTPPFAAGPGEEPNRQAFVVLRHVDAAGVHYDLMIDEGQSLATWKCRSPPESASDRQPVICTRSPDHRRMYLDYEGPISEGRGQVNRHDHGWCTIRQQGSAAGAISGRLAVIFGGRLLRGPYALVRSETDDQLWSLAPARE